MLNNSQHLRNGATKRCPVCDGKFGRDRADIVAERQHQAQALASLKIEKAKIDAERQRAEADVGPLRYLAELTGAPATDLERPVRLLTLALVRRSRSDGGGPSPCRRHSDDASRLKLRARPFSPLA